MIKKKDILLSTYFAIVFGLFSLISFVGLNDVNESNGCMITFFIISAIIWFVLSEVMIIAIGAMKEKKTIAIQWPVLLEGLNDKKFFLITCAFFFLMWLPTYLALFPGTFGYDAPIQFAYWKGYVPWSDHHPVAHTVFIGLFYELGKMVTGTDNGGMATCSFVQALIVTSSISYCLTVLRRKGVRFIYWIISVIFLGFNPFLKVLSFNCTKDVLFGAFFLFFIMILYQLILDKLIDIKKIIGLFVVGVLMCILRHQGIYILVVWLVFSLFTTATKNKKITIICTIMAIVFAVEGYSSIIHNTLEIEAGDSREMLSVPMQQMAYVCKAKLEGDTRVTVTDEELAQIESFIPEEGIRSYLSYNADPVKSTFDTASFKADLLSNIKVYIEIGLKNKRAYITVVRKMIEPYIHSEDMQFSSLMFAYTYPEIYSENIHLDSKNTFLYNELYKMTVDNYYNKLPVVNVIYDVSFSVWMLAVWVGMIFYRRNYNSWIICLPLILYMASLLLGPAALIRYLYPLVLFVPFMGYMILHEDRVEGK